MSDAGTIPAIGSGFGTPVRLNAPDLRPANRVAAGVVASFVASSAAGFVSDFTAVSSEGPTKFSAGIGDATGTAGAVVKEEDELSVRVIPFVPNNGGVFGLGIADDVALALWSTNSSTEGSGDVGLTSAGVGVGDTWLNGSLEMPGVV